jgi:hypothetical protein
MVRFTLSIAFLVFLTTQIFAEAGSGNEIAGGCRRVAQNISAKSMLEAAEDGFCLGLVNGLFASGEYLSEPFRFCRPRNADVGQAVRVLAKYLSDNPGKTNATGSILAVAAFRQTWPCRAN